LNAATLKSYAAKQAFVRNKEKNQERFAKAGINKIIGLLALAMLPEQTEQSYTISFKLSKAGIFDTITLTVSEGEDNSAKTFDFLLDQRIWLCRSSQRRNERTTALYIHT